jgi:hypothetical protein
MDTTKKKELDMHAFPLSTSARNGSDVPTNNLRCGESGITARMLGFGLTAAVQLLNNNE